jgi:hypothetical protein
MFGSYGRSDAAVSGGLARKLKVQKRLVAVENTRGGLRKKSLIHNGATPKIDIDPETYAVTADGELLVCEPADRLPMAQRYFFVLRAHLNGGWVTTTRPWRARQLHSLQNCPRPTQYRLPTYRTNERASASSMRSFRTALSY